MERPEISFLILFLVVIGLYLWVAMGKEDHPALGQTQTPLEKRPAIWRCLDARDADVRAIVRLAELGIDEQLLDEYNKRSHDLLLDCRENALEDG